jgi:hypothetical protein
MYHYPVTRSLLRRGRRGQMYGTATSRSFKWLPNQDYGLTRKRSGVVGPRNAHSAIQMLPDDSFTGNARLCGPMAGPNHVPVRIEYLSPGGL